MQKVYQHLFLLQWGKLGGLQFLQLRGLVVLLELLVLRVQVQKKRERRLY